MLSDFESLTRARAYAIWEAEGRPDGRHVEHWLAAEAKCRPEAPPKARRSRVRRPSPSEGDGSTVASPAPRNPRRKKVAASSPTPA